MKRRGRGRRGGGSLRKLADTSGKVTRLRHTRHSGGLRWLSPCYGSSSAPLAPAASAQLERSRAAALIDESAYAAGRLVLTRQGRLLADAVIRDLT